MNKRTLYIAFLALLCVTTLLRFLANFQPVS